MYKRSCLDKAVKPGENGDYSTNAEEVVIKYAPQLLSTLKLGDPLFVVKLLSAGFLPGHTRNKIKSLNTDIEKADYFIDNVLLPSVATDGSILQDFLLIMENSGYRFASQLIRNIYGSVRDKTATG